MSSESGSFTKRSPITKRRQLSSPAEALRWVSNFEGNGSLKKNGRATTLPKLLPHELIGCPISVPYAILIPDDYSGCTCDATVLDVRDGQCLVILAGEKQWQPTEFIERWRTLPVDPLCGLFDGLGMSPLAALAISSAWELTPSTHHVMGGMPASDDLMQANPDR